MPPPPKVYSEVAFFDSIVKTVDLEILVCNIVDVHSKTG